MILRVLMALAVVVALVGCAATDEKTKALEPVKLVDFDETVKVSKVWSKSAGSGQDQRYSKLMPAMDSKALYVTDVDGKVFAYSRDTQKLLWSKKTHKDISASIAVAGNKLFFGTYDGELIALDASNGEQLWQGQVSSEILAVPAANSNVAIVQTIDGRLFGFSTSDGSQLWRYDHVIPALTLRGTASPVIVRNQVFAAFGNGQLVSLNVSDGSLLWSGRVSQPKGRTELEKMVDVDGSPVVAAGLVYAASYHGAVAAFSRAKGQVIWKQDLSSFNNLSVANGRVYVVTEESHVVAYNAVNGSVVWINDQLHRRNVGAPLAIGEYVVCIDSDGHLHVLNRATGDFAYRFKPSGSGFQAPMLVDGNTFLVLSDNGKLSAYQIKPR